MDTVPFDISNNSDRQHCWDELTALLSSLLPAFTNADDPTQQMSAVQAVSNYIGLAPVSCHDIPETVLRKFGLFDTFFEILRDRLGSTNLQLSILIVLRLIWITVFDKKRKESCIDSRFLPSVLQLVERNHDTVLTKYALNTLFAAFRIPDVQQQLISVVDLISAVFMHPSSSYVQRRNLAYVLDHLITINYLFEDFNAICTVSVDIIQLLYMDDQHVSNYAIHALVRLITQSPKVTHFLNDQCIFGRCLELLCKSPLDGTSTLQVLTALVTCSTSPPDYRVVLLERLVVLWSAHDLVCLGDALLDLIESHPSLLEVRGVPIVLILGFVIHDDRSACYDPTPRYFVSSLTYAMMRLMVGLVFTWSSTFTEQVMFYYLLIGWTPLDSSHSSHGHGSKSTT